MSDELEPQDNINEEPVQDEIIQESVSEEVPSKAKATGHMSKEEWIASGHDEKDYKTEKEFELTGELIELKKIIKHQQTDIKEILKYHDDVISAQKISFKQQLEAQIKYAKETGDVEQVEKLVQERQELHDRERKQSLEKQNKSIEGSIQEFIERNKDWYNEQNIDLVKRAQDLEVEIRSGEYTKRTGIPAPATYEGILRQIELEIKSGKRNAPAEPTRPFVSNTQSAVNKQSTASQSDDYLLAKLSSSEKSMYYALKRMNSQIGADFTVKQFIDKTKADKEV
jgi:hypothetical protein